jgi:hypothetical protein
MPGPIRGRKKMHVKDWCVILNGSTLWYFTSDLPITMGLPKWCKIPKPPSNCEGREVHCKDIQSNAQYNYVLLIGSSIRLCDLIDIVISIKVPWVSLESSITLRSEVVPNLALFNTISDIRKCSKAKYLY